MGRTKMKDFILSLSEDEARQILLALLANDPALVKKAYAIAKEMVSNVDIDEICSDVCYALNSLDVDDLYNSSGRTRDGYVDPNDRAWEMFEEALSPFIHEMEINQKRSLPSIAKIYCIGIIKGLLKYEKESYSEFTDWVPDAPGENIITVVDEWKKGNPSSEDIAEVMAIVKGIDQE